MKKNTLSTTVSLAVFAALAGAAVAQPCPCPNPPCIYDEIEPNNTKEDALTNAQTPCGLYILGDGDGITGVSLDTGALEYDYFLVQTPPAAPGIYRHRMVLDNQEGTWNVTLRGYSQTAGIINTVSDQSIQQGTPSPAAGSMRRVLQWYGFGKEEQVFYRVQGASTEPYTVRMQQVEITPVDLGTFQPGEIEITTDGQGHTSATALWIYDSNFDIIPGYGNHRQPEPGTGNTSRLTRNFEPGTYYMALTLATLVVPEPAAPDDRRQDAVVSQFPDLALTANSLATGDLSFQVTDATGPQQFAAAREERLDILWYTFTVGGAAPCYANCDDSTVEPILNVDDFTCFINEFAAAQSLPHEQQVASYPNCDGSTIAPALNVDDFTCFINAFAAGCN